jgi:hypothetical protein
LDVAINLVALGGADSCNCHGRVHSGQILRIDLLAIVAARESTTQDAIKAEIARLRKQSRKD